MFGLGTVALASSGRAEPEPQAARDAGAAAAANGVVPSQRTAVGPTLSALASGAVMEDRDSAIQGAYRSLELRLTRKSDGSFVYTGRGFDARIDALGGLTMRDKFSVARFVFNPQPLDDHTWITYFFRIRYDLFARIDKAFGNDSYRSERRAFLEQTRELRELLLERNADRALERTLEGLWKLAWMSVREKKERLFDLWSECSSDVHGQRARCRIEAFIRERCPRGSACEYTDEELVRLGPQAAGKVRFAPYDSAE